MFVGALAAPLFQFLVGVGISFSATKSRQFNQRNLKTVLRLAQRGFMLILGGYLFNLVVFYMGDNPQDLLAVDILQIIGLSILLSIPFIWLPAPVVISASILLIIVAQTANTWALPSWLDPIVTGQSGIGYFPLALWLPYVYLGLAFGKVYPTWQKPGKSFLVLIGIGLTCLLFIPLMDPAWGYRHPRPIFIVFSCIFIACLVTITWYWTERGEHRDIVSRSLHNMGRASLMLYVFHHLFGYRLFYHLGWVAGRSWRGEFGVFTHYQATILLLGLVMLMLAASSWWLLKPPRSIFNRYF